MSGLDSYDGEDWKEWIVGKYDNRYAGVGRCGDYDHNENYYRPRKTKRKIFLFVLILALFLPFGLELIDTQKELDMLNDLAIFDVKIYAFYFGVIQTEFNKIIVFESKPESEWINWEE